MVFRDDRGLLPVAERHLWGKHDQKKHGRDGADDLPKGWVDASDGDRVRLVGADGALSVEAGEDGFMYAYDSTGGFLRLDHAGARGRARAAAARVAVDLDTLDRVNPSLHGVHAKIVTDLPEHTGGETKWGFALGEPAYVRVNANLFTPEGEKQWRQAVSNGHNHGDPDDPVRTLVTHEYGHVLAMGAAERLEPTLPPKSRRRPEQVILAASSRAVNLAMDSAGVRPGAELGQPGNAPWQELSRYARTSGAEAYAECFTSWAMRDVVPPTRVATALAEQEGWK